MQNTIQALKSDIRQARDTVRRLEKALSLLEGDVLPAVLDPALATVKRTGGVEERVIEHLRAFGRATVGELVTALGDKRSSVAATCTNLFQADRLTRTLVAQDRGRPMVYAYQLR